jgi:hypothetical protein
VYQTHGAEQLTMPSATNMAENLTLVSRNMAKRIYAYMQKIMEDTCSIFYEQSFTWQVQSDLKNVFLCFDTGTNRSLCMTDAVTRHGPRVYRSTLLPREPYNVIRIHLWYFADDPHSNIRSCIRQRIFHISIAQQHTTHSCRRSCRGIKAIIHLYERTQYMCKYL